MPSRLGRQGKNLAREQFCADVLSARAQVALASDGYVADSVLARLSPPSPKEKSSTEESSKEEGGPDHHEPLSRLDGCSCAGCVLLGVLFRQHEGSHGAERREKE